MLRILISSYLQWIAGVSRAEGTAETAQEPAIAHPLLLADPGPPPAPGHPAHRHQVEQPAFGHPQLPVPAAGRRGGYGTVPGRNPAQEWIYKERFI